MAHFVKIAKITAVYIAANLLNSVSNSRKIYILRKIHTMMMSRSHITPVTKHTDFGSRGKGKENISVLNSHNELQIMITKTKYSCENVKQQVLAKNVAFWQNHGIHGI